MPVVPWQFSIMLALATLALGTGCHTTTPQASRGIIRANDLERAAGSKRVLALPQVSVVEEHLFFSADAVDWLILRSKVAVLARDAAEAPGRLRTYSLLVVPVPKSASELISAVNALGVGVLYPQVLACCDASALPKGTKVSSEGRPAWIIFEIHALTRDRFSPPVTPFSSAGNVFSIAATLHQDQDAQGSRR